MGGTGVAAAFGHAPEGGWAGVEGVLGLAAWGSAGKSAGVADDDPNVRWANRNEHLAGSTHPVTGVSFDMDGFPMFDSQFDHQLSKELYTATDDTQFADADKALQQYLKERLDPTLQQYLEAHSDADVQQYLKDHPDSGFSLTSKQLQDAFDGEHPDGYTWHHHQDPGKLQLVDQWTHAKTGHTGGKSIWGGGSANR